MTNKIEPFEKLVDYVKKNPQKGLTIPHTDIEKIIGLSYRMPGCHHLNNQYSYQVSKANKKLTEMSLRLEAIQGFGYRIIKDNQYIDSMRKAYNMAVRNIDKAKFIADNTDTNNLSKTELAEYNTIFDEVKLARQTLSIIVTNSKKKP